MNFIQKIGIAYLVTIGLQVLAVPHIQQIQVTRQVGSSCGYHAVYNATAVDTLAWQAVPLTSAAIIQEARQYRDFIQRDAILGDTIIDLANQLNVGNLYCVNGRNGLAFAGSSQGSQEGNQFLRDVVANRQNANPLIGHFVVNTGSHWVTFSVVKQPDQEVMILYMDSMNTPLARNRVAQTVGNTLLTRLGGVAERTGGQNARGARAERSERAEERVPGRAGRSSYGRSGRNSVQPERGFRRNHRPDNNSRRPEYVQPDYASAYDQDDVQVQEASKDTEFSYKTYLAVGLVCFLIGLKFGSTR